MPLTDIGTGAIVRADAPLIKLEIQFQAGLASLCQDRQRNVLVPCNKLPDLSPLICSANSKAGDLAVNGQKVVFLLVDLLQETSPLIVPLFCD